MKNALILAPFAQEQLQRLRGSLRVTHESWLDSKRLYDPDELAQRLNRQRVHCLVIEADFVFSETLEQVTDLRLIGICRNALNHVDLEAATEWGILVVNAPGRNALAVAELTVGMMLGLARHIPSAHHSVRTGRWTDPVAAYEEFRGAELSGKTAGIIGLGAIGEMVARRLQAMEMKVIANDPYVSPQKARDLDVALVEADRLLAESDYVLVHTPAVPATLGLVAAEQLQRMKPTAFLVNTSAPGVVEEKALAEALSRGQIAGAALDVFDGQPLPPSSKLLSLDNVLLTPHIGGATHETIQRHSKMIADDVLLFHQGKRPERLVNPEAWERRPVRQGV